MIINKNMMMMSNNNNNNKLPLTKTNSFPFKHTSPPISLNNNSNQYQPRRSPHQVEFPNSARVPQLQGDEMFHFSHPQHPISQTHLPDLFTCSACKEYGAGERFTCLECDYQLHDFCALAPEALTRHPIHPLHKIVYFPKPVKGGKSKCDICAKSTKGCVFKCTVCSFQMHPCCAMLSTELNIAVHPHTLRLLAMPLYSSNTDPGFVCSECNKRRSGRVYHCTVCDYHLHAVCAKNMVNGLQANGIKAMEKSSRLGTAAKVAKKMMRELIGGIMEGIGEGVGQVLIQSAARGRCYVRSARTS